MNKKRFFNRNTIYNNFYFTRYNHKDYISKIKNIFILLNKDVNTNKCETSSPKNIRFSLN